MCLISQAREDVILVVKGSYETGRTVMSFDSPLLCPDALPQVGRALFC